MKNFSRKYSDKLHFTYFKI